LINVSNNVEPLERTPQQIALFINALREFNSMKEYEKKMKFSDWVAFGMAAKIELYSRGKTLCKIGEPSTKVFFTLQGRVLVAFVRKVDLEECIKNNSPIIKSGSSIGEVGVILEDNRYAQLLIHRTATCVALDGVISLSLGQKIFQTVLGAEAKIMKQKRIRTLMLAKPFSFWGISRLAGLSIYILLRNYEKNQYVYHTGDIREYIFVIIEGEVEIVYSPHDSSAENSPHDHDRINKYRKKNRFRKQELSLVKLGPGNHFGDEEGYDQSQKKYGIRVTSTRCHIYLIPFDVLKSILSLENQKKFRGELHPEAS